ncbi:MAG: BTAD domain-containing putative transcriptional regulator [Arhodomonas sp.]|nr:BTAD domain-containing putative transcriptional regulator [Arhodomonas sp.]
MSVDGRPVEGLEGTKSGALLAYLAVEKAVAIPRARLAADFWPELSDRAGRNNLRQTLYQLRQRLATACDGAHDWIELSRDAVRFSSEEPHWVDVEVLTRDPPCCGQGAHTAACRPALEGMQAVLDTYGGPFLQGFDSGDLPPSVAEWLTRCRRYYRDAVVAVLERFTACLTRAGAIQRALEYTRRFITIEPDAEAAHRILLRLLHHNEAVDEAIRHYDALAERLFEEQGRMPEAETVALGERLLTRRDQMRRLALADEGSGLERRLVSVVAVTFRPNATHGPEGRARVYSDVSRQVGAIVEEFGGLPGRSHGGRLIVYFGLPEAGDATTMQAVRAAFRIVRTVQAGGTLQVAVHSDWLLTTAQPGTPRPRRGPLRGGLPSRRAHACECVCDHRRRPYPRVPVLRQPAAGGSSGATYPLSGDCGPPARGPNRDLAATRWCVAVHRAPCPARAPAPRMAAGAPPRAAAGYRRGGGGSGEDPPRRGVAQ